MILFKTFISLLFASIVTFTIFHIVFNLLFGGGLFFNNMKLNKSKIFFTLLSISFIGALVVYFTNIERSMASAFVGGISCFLVPSQRKNNF